ncbi:hypothetical protein D0Z03_001077 [Geotrichum reessii]|nr:hypothetical protein D0Z03_001077 [Galactomyces reessii]
MEVTMGKMRCLHALGEWEQLSKLAQEKWTNASQDIRRAVAPLAAAAAWGLSQWERMDTYIGVMKTESPDRSFFQAILNIHRGKTKKAAEEIVLARDLLATELTALVSESYNRAYNVVVRVQMLAELEEVIAYKDEEHPLDEDARKTMRKTWMKRLKGCDRNVDIWQRMLKVRALVIKPKEDMNMWIKFANLCRKSGRLGLAEKSLNRLLEPDERDANGNTFVVFHPKVVYAQLKYMWAMGDQEEALKHLLDFTSKMSLDLNLQQLPQPQALELQYVSPKLLAARNLQLAVPGTYVPSKPVIGIARFDPTLYTGKVIHIDFGDCFEAAILREKFPEKVPFRLTRMLRYAMEVSGIEGSYRITCEHVMSLLRENKDSLMAILEAFAYDPLINWGFEIPTKGEGGVVLASSSNMPGGAGFLDDKYANGGGADIDFRRPSAVSIQTANTQEVVKGNNQQQKTAAVRNARAGIVLKRITDKLTGNDFKRVKDLDVPTQVKKLILQATDVENLCLHYIGWCSFW